MAASRQMSENRVRRSGRPPVLVNTSVAARCFGVRLAGRVQDLDSGGRERREVGGQGVDDDLGERHSPVGRWRLGWGNVWFPARQEHKLLVDPPPAVA
jgi:hypothetical protein